MNTKYINFFLIAVIAAVVGGMGFFGWRAWSGRSNNPAGTSSLQPQFPLPVPATNKQGKEFEENDAAMEKDVRIMNDAVLAYANDYNGKYPESDFKNPCAGVRYCLKGVNINTKAKRYLEEVPQTIGRLDYHYRADNGAKAYCIKTPNVLETDVSSVFQCTHEGCAKTPIGKSCN